MSNIVDQVGFAKSALYQSFSDGALTLSYTDRSHVPADEWRDLLQLTMKAPPFPGIAQEHSYTFRLTLDKRLTNPNGKANGKASDRNVSVVRDTIALSATRVGILSPAISGQTAEQLLALKNARGIVLIPDTNSLYNGTLHWLLNVLKDTSVWLMPFVMSLTQIQAREAHLKSLANSFKETNLPQALRSRGLVNAGLSFLERNRHRYQVLELDPSLLRYMRSGGKGGMDQDEGDILEDRLLIEGVHAVLRSTRTRATQLVVTSDALLSRVLGAEGIPNLFLPAPTLQDEDIPSIRYDAWAGMFMGSSVRGFVWDLAHAFGTIRLANDHGKSLSLTCYWPGKQPQDWIAEHLQVQDNDTAAASDDNPEALVDAAQPSEDAVNVEPKATKASKPAQPATPAIEDRADKRPAKRRQPQAAAPAIGSESAGGQSVFSDAPVPQSSLPFALKAAGVLYRTGSLTFDALMEKFPAPKPDRGNVRRSLEVVRRAGLIELEGDTIRPRPELDDVESSIQKGDLDAISAYFENFEAYKIILAHLKDRGELARDQVRPLLSSALNTPVPQEATIRLVRYHVLLGQCWTDGSLWRNGSHRLAVQELLEAFTETYEQIAKDNIAQVSEFLPTFCRTTMMSPWALSRSVHEHASLLSEKFAFGYAVGGKPTGGDAVIAGSLLRIEETPVPMDRFVIGGRPVFTIERIR